MRGIKRLAAWTARLDDAIVAIGHALWRATIDGYAIYGETLCAPMSAANLRTGDDDYERHAKPATAPLLCLETDGRTWQEYEHIEDLLESLRIYNIDNSREPMGQRIEPST